MFGSDLGYLLEDLRVSLSLASSAKLSFGRRIANKVAHSLAHTAMQSRTNIDFSLVPSQSVEELISSEYNDH